MGIVSYLYSGTRLAENIRSILIVLGIQKMYNILNMKKLNKHPTPQMFYAREFYTANTKRIEAVKNMLADEESKTVFTKLIHMRQYYDTKDIPHYNYFNQYFPKDIIQCSKNEVFVDCGAFNGDTVKTFIKHCPDYGSVIAFEPDNENFLKLNRNLKHKRNIHTVKAGVYNHTGYVNFIDGKGGGSTINNQQSTINNQQSCISVTTIDTYEECKKATFIKMDIEGAELPALQGAEHIIKKNKPKLAISIYHSDEDMLRLAEYIHKIVPEYKLYIRAHTMGIAETILYAVM